jgi:hypothetical protein
VSRLGSLAGHLFLVLFGLVLGLLLFELGLQAAAVWMRRDGQSPVAWVTGRRRVLCLGDSNTYGLSLGDRTDAWPQQLEKLWNAVTPSRPAEVLNPGYPGTNSSRPRRDLPAILRARPIMYASWRRLPRRYGIMGPSWSC